MKNLNEVFVKSVPILAIGGLILAATVGYMYWDLQLQYDALKSEKTALEKTLSVKEETLALIESEKTNLQGELVGEKQKVEELGEQVSEITETVEELDKLRKTDPELLQKYSKIFFLNEHYTPEKLISIDVEYRWDEEKDMQIHASVWPYLEDMLSEAVDDEVSMYVVSAYRSFGTQSALKSGYKFLYGSGANRFSADQGYSEHQLGTTVDLTMIGVGAALGGFEKTEAYIWLQENAYKYGFVLSYPKGNTYYVFEPWHWRFVGRKLARKLHREEMDFYNLDQREIDEYLISFFD